ncbi:CAP domain-containing protein [Cupriavidus sp. DF5525]|uniref:CAP domain-containing protein n=1 Tax=Cupriavidus sp. DF5525 TaxID=3160989 RepID=UPI0032DF0390
MLANSSIQPRAARPAYIYPALHLIAACAAVVLSGCGGDGDGGDSATKAVASGSNSATQPYTSRRGGSGSPTTPTTPATGGACYTVSGSVPAPANTTVVSLLPARGAGVSNYTVLGEPRSAGLCYVNFRREQIGLPPLVARDALGTAAQNHTSYMLANNMLTHSEQSGKPGYTGATPDARIQALYPTKATAEVVAGANRWTSVANAQLSLSPKDALVVDLLNAPFHRAALLGSYQSAGSGYAESVGPNGSGTAARYFQTIDLADASKPGTDNQMVAYPFDGQTDVPPSWVNNESPNPAPGYEGKTVGYPVLLQAINTSLQFATDTFTLADAQGRNVSCLKVDSRSTGMSSYARGLAICTPQTPLASKQRYSVTVAGKLGTQPVNLSWSFTTR